MFSTETATGSATTSASDVEGESSFMREEEAATDDQEHHRPEERPDELKIRRNTTTEDFLIGDEHGEQRVESHAGPHPRREERDRIQDWRYEEQNPQEVLHQLRDVAHEHSERRKEQPKPEVQCSMKREQERKERDARA